MSWLELRSRTTWFWMRTIAFVLSGLAIACRNKPAWSFDVIVTLMRPYSSFGSDTVTDARQVRVLDPSRTTSIHVALEVGA